jgi:tetratricopeptide (TPR) repeat protein
VGTRIELLAGDRAAAERELRAAYAIYEASGERAYLAAVSASLARLLCELGRYDEAGQLAEVAERTAAKGDLTTQVRRRAAQAKVLAHRGALDEAEALAREAVTLTDGTEFPDWRADTLLDLSEVLRAAAHAEQANTAIRGAVRLYESKGNLVSAENARAAPVSLRSVWWRDGDRHRLDPRDDEDGGRRAHGRRPRPLARLLRPERRARPAGP